MPDTTPNSEQLHQVVELSSGIRDDHYVRSNVKMKQNPVDKLKEALSSKAAFQKYYLVRKSSGVSLAHYFMERRNFPDKNETRGIFALVNSVYVFREGRELRKIEIEKLIFFLQTKHLSG